MATPTTGPERRRHNVLADGGFTAAPRWTTAPVPGSADLETTIPDRLVAALLRRADELGTELGSVLLAAHAKVLARLSGERTVGIGYVAAPDARVLPCRLTVAEGSWQSLLLSVRQSEAEARSVPMGAAPAGDDGAGPRPEVVFDPTGHTGRRTQGVVLDVSVPERDGRRFLRLRYRTDRLDAQCAGRIAGYHLSALEQIAADPAASHGQRSLLSAEELRLQIDGLAGPHRDLPDLRFHEVFEQRVRAHPDAVAVAHRGQRWTYRELNSRANRLAHALLDAGLRSEDVVAVMTERNPEWMAGVLAVFKAGGAYLPIEPHFPPDRIATMLSRSSCRLVLTEQGSSANLDRVIGSLPGTRKLVIGALGEEDRPEDDPGIAVSADRLAYVYFTSGSTGEPKGAMCEHAGMLNHLYAKIDDLGIRASDVVAQTAPQCFDISLWQLFAALLVGGQTLLVEQETILDVQRFLDAVVDGRVSVLQVVPSYLDVVLSGLERSPRAMPDLRCVSVTGEALKKELVQRWFTARPGSRLVNAYGLTETSDDTNHEVMDGPPDGERIPLGRPVNNVRLYIVDEDLSPVPLGAPGTLVFSGVCVGRGYVNDAERTRRDFPADPHRPGQRLYRSGDFGRWRPDGKVEFLGRRDAQVKIRGFRIEIGEIENALLRVPGVRDGAVVVTEPAGRGKQLAAFYTGPGRLPRDVVRDRLADVLPAYMIPGFLQWREILPLTANGKTDRKSLTVLAEALDVAADSHEAPSNATERRLAAAWAAVLGIPRERVGRHDNFFDLGGTSLSAVRLAIRLDRAVSLRDLVGHPVLTELAGLVDARTGSL